MSQAVKDKQVARYPLGIPNGWYVVERSRNLAPGEVKILNYFDGELVLFRGEDGVAGLLDAYCDHLGAHLGHGGKVVGGSLQCPFHNWEWNGSGKCLKIPYTTTIPPAARIRHYPVAEHSGMIWAWYHRDGIAPSYEVPPIPKFGAPGWQAEQYSIDWVLNTHAQEIYENGADYQHFVIVHKFEMPSGVVTRYEGHETIYGFDTALDPDNTAGGRDEMRHEGRIIGLGVSFIHIKGELEVVVFNATTPISSDQTHIRFDVLGNMRYPDEATAAAKMPAYAKSMATVFAEDFEIWEHKKYRTQPKLCNKDGPIVKFREWAAQFYC
jgi:3-ketosteroid 9alpha-monooxygenase subunit A